jgi:hypothetical protein
MGRKWVLVEDDSQKVVVWLCVLLGQESVMQDDDDEIIVFCFRSKKELIHLVCKVCGKANTTDVNSKCTFIDVSEFNHISNHLQNMDNMVILLDIELGSCIQTKSNFDEKSEQKAFWLNCIQDKTTNNVICITSTESNPAVIIKKCGKPDRMRPIGTVEGNLKDQKKLEDDKGSAKTALEQADKFWHYLNGPNVLLSALEEAQNITNGKPAHPEKWPPEFKKEKPFPFNVNLLKHNDDHDSLNQALEAFKALFEYPEQGIDLCEKATVLGVWRCKGCRPLTVKHIADVLEKAGIQCSYKPDVATQEINLPTMPGVVFLWRLARFLLEGLDGWNGEVILGVDDNGDYLHPYFILPIPNHCYHDFVASYHVRRNPQGAGVLAFEKLLCCRLPESSDGINGGDIKHVNYLGLRSNCSNRGSRLVPLVRHEFRDKEIYISWISKKFKKAKED